MRRLLFKASVPSSPPERATPSKGKQRNSRKGRDEAQKSLEQASPPLLPPPPSPAPHRNKLGIEEDNKGIEITEIWWLLKESRLGEKASSIVIYMRVAEAIDRLRMGRRFFCTTRYERDRLSTGTQQRATYPTSSTISTECGLRTGDMGCLLWRGGLSILPACILRPLLCITDTF